MFREEPSLPLNLDISMSSLLEKKMRLKASHAAAMNSHCLYPSTKAVKVRHLPLHSVAHTCSRTRDKEKYLFDPKKQTHTSVQQL